MTERVNPPGPPVRDRPYAPGGYGIRPGSEGMISWSHVQDRMSAAHNYWVATNRSDGRPHVTPAWGQWVDGTVYFGGTPRSRKARNLAVNPNNVAVHLESGDDDVVILEGTSEVVTDPDPALSERFAAASITKYGMGSSDIEGSYTVRPRVVFAWPESSFPGTATRWLFERD